MIQVKTDEQGMGDLSFMGNPLVETPSRIAFPKNCISISPLGGLVKKGVFSTLKSVKLRASIFVKPAGPQKSLVPYDHSVLVPVYITLL